MIFERRVSTSEYECVLENNAENKRSVLRCTEVKYEYVPRKKETAAEWFLNKLPEHLTKM